MWFVAGLLNPSDRISAPLSPFEFGTERWVESGRERGGRPPVAPFPSDRFGLRARGRRPSGQAGGRRLPQPGKRPSSSVAQRPSNSTSRASARRRTFDSKRGRPPLTNYPTVDPSRASLLARPLVLLSFALLVSSIVTLTISIDSSSYVPFVSALLSFGFAALSEAVHRVRCDKLNSSDRFLAAAVLRVIALWVAVICAYFVARAAAL